MGGLEGYVLSVVSGAFICGIVLALLGNSGAGDLLRLLCGVYMTVVVLSPVRSLDLSQIPDSILPSLQQAEETAAEGEQYAKDQLRDIIKSNAEAYVLDKASQMGVDITVEITLSSEALPVPVKADIRGNLAPYQKRMLQTVLTEELGIPKEDQRWIG